MRNRGAKAALSLLFWLLDTLLGTIERARRGWLCLRHGHEFKQAFDGGQRCTRCPEWRPR